MRNRRPRSASSDHMGSPSLSSTSSEKQATLVTRPRSVVTCAPTGVPSLKDPEVLDCRPCPPK
jgi:hypothetical protein